MTKLKAFIRRCCSREAMVDNGFAKYISHRNRKLVRILNICLAVNMIYVLIIRYIFIKTVTTYYAAVSFGLIAPVTLATVLLTSFVTQRCPSWLWHMEHMVIAFNSILFAFFISLRAIVCHYGIDAQCDPNQRPLVNALLAYVMAGPVFAIFVQRVNLVYEIIAMTFGVAWYTYESFLVYSTHTHANTLYVIIGFYAAILYIADYTRDNEFNEYRQRAELAEQNQKLVSMQERQAELERANQAFVAYIFHEIRNPLNNAVMTLNIVRRDIEEVTQVINQLMTIKDIMVDAVDYSDITRPLSPANSSSSHFNFVMLVSDIIKGMHGEFFDGNVGLTLHFDTVSRQSIVSHDERRLKQVLVVLFRFCLKRSQSLPQNHVHLTVSTSRSGVKGEVAEFHCLVEDHGPPLSSETLQMGFNKIAHHDGPDALRGEGLTMSLVSTILRAMNSKPTLAPALKEKDNRFGMSFALLCELVGSLDFVPEIPDLEKARKLEERGSSGLSGGATKKVLVVDDDPLTRKLIRKILEKFPCIIDEAVDGVQCLEKLLSTGQEYDLVTLDIQMPKLDGKGVLRRLNEIGQKVTIVCVTANCTPADVEELKRLGARDVLGKPCRPLDFAKIWKRVF